MLLPKVQNPAKKKNRVVQNEAIRMLAVQKRKTTGRNSLKTKNQTSVKKGGQDGHRRRSDINYRKIIG